jgi:OOP family OmpA-OmpF porin
MHKKKFLGAALVACGVLSTPAAFAEDYSGFYFGLRGGTGDAADLPSRSDYDDAINSVVAAEVASAPGTVALLATGDSSLDDSFSVWGADIGYRFNKYVALEVGYTNLGKWLYRMPILVSGTYLETRPDGSIVTYNLNGVAERDTQITSSGITGSVLGILPIGGRIDLHLRGGLYFADTRDTNRIRYVSSQPALNIAHGRTDASDTELFAGLGGAFTFNENFALRVEYQKYFDVGDDEKMGETDIDVINLSVLFK